MPNSSAIDAALFSRLVGDATLSTILTDGWYFDAAKQGAQKFGIVSLIDGSEESVFVDGRAIETRLYLVKAVILSTSRTTAVAAADRIDAILQDHPLTVAGYNSMSLFRETPIEITEVDSVDPSIRWQHYGGHYTVEMSVVGA